MRGNFTTKNEQKYVKLINIKSGFYSKNDKNGKTKAVVWNVIWTAMKPEKKIWAAEIEIYRLVMSKGSQGTGKISKWSVYFWISGLVWQRNIVYRPIFDGLVSRKALKAQISSSKIVFWWIFWWKQLKIGFLGFFGVVFSNFVFGVFFGFAENFQKIKNTQKN